MKRKYIVTQRSIVEDCGFYEASSKQAAIDMFNNDLNWGTKVIKVYGLKARVAKEKS